MRIALLPSIFCFLSTVIVPVSGAEQQSLTTKPGAMVPEYDLRVDVLEFTGPMDALKASTLSELDTKIIEQRKAASEASRNRTPWRARRAGSQPASGAAEQDAPRRPVRAKREETPSVRSGGGAQLVLRIPDEGTARANVAARVPFAETPKGTTRRGVRVSYGEVGVRVEISRVSESGDQPDSVVLQMKLEATLPSLAGGKEKPQTLEKKVSISPGHAMLLPLDEEPVAMDEGGAGRWRAVSLELVDSTKKTLRFREPPQSSDAAPEPGTHLEFDCLQVTIEEGAMADIDLHKLVAEAPPAAELMKRLKEWGDPIRSYSTEISFDSGKGLELLGGQRAPTVQNINISGKGVVTPSVTYEEVGTIARIGPLKWEKDERGGLRATGSLRLENAGIAHTPIEISPGVRLPSFSQWRLDESYVFRSGVPSYFTFRGPPTPPTPDGSVTLYVARLLITRPGR